MAFLAIIYRHGIWISVPIFAIFVVMLIICIAGVVRSIRQARLFDVPLKDRQEIDFTETGAVVLSTEGPMLSRRFAKLTYELTGPDGLAVNSRIALFRARTTTVRKARMELRVFDITLPGRHVFHINGLEGDKPTDAQHRVVFTRPHLRYSMLYVIGIVIASIFTIGSIVLFFLRLAPDEISTQGSLFLFTLSLINSFTERII